MDIDKSIPCNPQNYNKSAGKRKIEYIVIHYTGGTGTAQQNAQYYHNATVSASAHYFVGHKSEGAKVYQSVEDNDAAWHCGTTGAYFHPYCRNSNSIGIETCCHNDAVDKSASSLNWYFDQETVDRLVELVRDLMQKYNISADHVVRHYDVTHKTCPAMWVHDEAAWRAFKARLVDETAELKTAIQSHINLSNPDKWWKKLDGDPDAKEFYRKWAESYK